ncbi:winged helix-turn-helix transcriptional regulator [Flexivirga sp. ID2601S]|uniref:Winged helix-turn-helix transcriptional regulator n=1 Tax=Flexivirga aerilata TaxID=1656889 RepID=A0A849AFZ8_9MICO|nr:MarR family winged helix-turn-helix transcriptional regulator [Flexivirga aerilata]NNG38181.1 winged helix-turn-helix transcriptional regulator [Flexivirga aerilata]
MPAPSPADPPRWLSPEELQTWWSLHLVLATLPGALGRQLQSDSGLSFLEYYVLAGLADRPDRTMRMGDLAAFANSEQSRLSHLMRRLEARGLVRRRRDPDDGRVMRAVLTDAGYDALVDAAPGHVERVRELVFDNLTEAEQRALRRAMGKIAAGLCPETGGAADETGAEGTGRT